MTQPTTQTEPDLSVMLGKVRLANPVMTASGTCGYAFELSDFVDLSQIGGFITKSITLHPRQGNPPQRTFETASGMLNAIGLANIGVERFCAERAPLLGRMGVPIFVNVAGKTVDEYVAVARQVAALPQIAGLELNVSCPNVKEGGLTFGTNPQAIEDLVKAVRQACPETPLIVKLTPNVTDITATARAAVEGGADILSLVNTFTALAVDSETRRPVLGNRTGGLSGPAIKPIALYLVHQVYTKVARPAGVPLIGLGGISCARDALEFIITGATAVAVGTNALADPESLLKTRNGICDYLVRHGLSSVRELVGTLS
jgi:dihydroorotate dehydrogenase (NAD+) catalytic subunit